MSNKFCKNRDKTMKVSQELITKNKKDCVQVGFEADTSDPYKDLATLYEDAAVVRPRARKTLERLLEPLLKKGLDSEKIKLNPTPPLKRMRRDASAPTPDSN